MGRWQEMFRSIYGAHNRRFYSAKDLILRLFEEAAIITEALRRESEEEIPSHIACFFGWLFAFCNDQEIDLGRAIFSKYGGVCPYCGQERNCVCISNETKPRAWKKDPAQKMPVSLQEWLQIFERIYGRINKVAGREKVWLHVAEELGEISRAFRFNQNREIQEELADLFAWLAAFCNLLKINLPEATYSAYPEKCITCNHEVCRCDLV